MRASHGYKPHVKCGRRFVPVGHASTRISRRFPAALAQSPAAQFTSHEDHGGSGEAALDEHGVAKMRWPERLEIVDAMPLTATRKIIKGRLTERLRGERA